MKHSQFIIPWEEGLYLRAATTLVKHATRFQSVILLKANERLANARSILAVLLLCASCGTVVELAITGIDEEDAMPAITEVFDAESMTVSNRLALQG